MWCNFLEYPQIACFSFIAVCQQDFCDLHHLLNVEPVLENLHCQNLFRRSNIKQNSFTKHYNQHKCVSYLKFTSYITPQPSVHRVVLLSHLDPDELFSAFQDSALCLWTKPSPSPQPGPAEENTHYTVIYCILIINISHHLAAHHSVL